MTSIKRLACVGAFLCFAQFIPRLAQAQCTGCTPTREVFGAGANYYFNDNVPQNVRDLVNAAAASWNAHFEAQGIVRRFVQGCCYEIKIDESIDPGVSNGYCIRGTSTSGTIAFAVSVRDSPNNNFIQSVAFHEFGHQTGWGDTNSCAYNESVMAPKGSWLYDNPTDFTPTDSCAFGVEFQPSGSNGGTDPGTRCTVGCNSPILISLDGKMELTDPSVTFDLGDGPKVYAWPESYSMTAFLTLDRNGDGVITDGRELFGTATPVGWGFEGRPGANGFEALAYYDRSLNAGNADGWITEADAIYEQLRLWFDRDHNGVSDPGELVSLKDAGIVSLSLTVATAQKQDRFGNLFRYRAKVKIRTPSGSLVDRFAYDVFLTSR